MSREHVIFEMPKRARGFTQTKSASAKKKARTGSFKPRAGYSSTARTRGGAVTGEMKYYDTAKPATVVASSQSWAATAFDPPTVNTLIAPTVGAGVNQRIGKAIKVYKIKLKGTFYVPQLITDDDVFHATQLRMIMFQDMQTNAAQANGSTIMGGAAASALEAVNSFQTIDNFGRFNMLWDKTIMLQDVNITYNSTTGKYAHNGRAIPFKKVINFKKPIQIRFNATNGGSIADIIDNSFHIAANCSSSETVYIGYNSRVCYKE